MEEIEKTETTETTEKTETRKSLKHIYNKDTGLPIMVNLYIIKYIYYHINKNEIFMDKKEDGGRGRAIPIYSYEIPVTRQRFDRINKGHNFEFSESNVKEITETFGIEREYFQWDSPKMFEIEGLTPDDWKKFYLKKYGVEYDTKVATDNTDIEKIEKRLKKIVATNWKQINMKNTPIYKICYYFHEGYRCDRAPRVDVVYGALKEMLYEEWDGVEKEKRKEMEILLKSHYRYIQALGILEQLKKKKKN